MAQDKHKKHKQWCENYKKSGQREINKALKQERHKRRMAKFAKRREEGKTYEYKPNPYKKGSRDWHIEREERSRKNVDRRNAVARGDSVFRKMENQLAKEAAIRKANEEERNKKKAKKKKSA
jgi:hypothetical protein